MSSDGQIAGGIIGGAIGFFLGGPTGALYGAQLGMGVGALIDPPKAPTINGPRLGDLSVQTSTYGANIPRTYGTTAMRGNVFWLEGNKLKEKSNKHKGVRIYNYYATFSVGIAKGPIAGVRRIWIGPRLIYDVNASPALSLAGLGVNFAWKVYNGDEAHTPDPRMQADRGVADTPAYRGLAYIVFYDLKLKEFGNSLLGAQVKVEVAQAASSTDGVTKYDLSVYDNFVEDFVYNPLLNEIWATKHFPNGITRINANTGALIGHIVTPGLCYPSIQYNPELKWITCASSGGMYVFNAETARYMFQRSFGAFSYIYVNGPTIESGWNSETGSVITPGVVWVPSGGAQAGATNGMLTGYDLRDGSIVNQFAIGVAPLRMCFDTLGTLWMIRNAASSSSTTTRLTCLRIGNGMLSDYNIPTAANDVMAYDPDRNSIWLATTSGASTNRLTEAKISNALGFKPQITFQPQIILPYNWTLTDAANTLRYDSTRKTLWVGSNDGKLMGVNTTSGAVTVIDTGTVHGIWTIADIEVNQGVVWICDPGSGVLARIAPGQQLAASVTLASIVQSECLLSSELQASDIDVTALTSQVRGFIVSQTGAIRGALDPLQSAWPFDIVPSGYKIKFVPRGTAPVATIQAKDLDARDGGESPRALLPMPREMDTQLPRRFTLKYLDVEREYDTGEQSAERLNTASINVREAEIAIVFSPTEAAQIAERLLFMYWLERTEAGPFRLPPTYLGLEPADVIEVVTDDATYRLRLDQVQYTADGRLECQAKLDSAATYTPAAVGEPGDISVPPVALTGPTRSVFLDIPLLSQDTNFPGFAVAMSGYLSGWPGGELHTTPDNGQTWEALLATLPPGTTMGTARNSLGAGRTDIVDTAASLQVDMNAALQSITYEDLLSGGNVFAYGVDGRWEIIAAQDCVQQGDGSWVLTNLMRGRYGTEWAMTLHADDDSVVLLEAADLSFVGLQTSDIGIGRLYRSVTAGEEIDSAYDESFTYRGVNLECLSPVYLNGDRHPTTRDWTLTWVRRTRTGGEWRDFVDAMLSETAEAYEIDIFSDGTYTTLKRTLTSMTPTVAYTSAQQVTDFGSDQSTLFVKIYQMSNVVGRGYPLTTSITRG